MRGFINASIFGMAMLTASAAFAQTPAYIGRHESTPEDLKAITKVTDDFQEALIKKDIKLLSSLMYNSNILFSAPADDGFVKQMREKTDVNFDGVAGKDGYGNFAKFIATSKQPVQEKFYNIKITQDRHVAWVIFDYEFLIDNKTQNVGVESWQMYKTDGKWKIFSVVWSMHGANDIAKLAKP